MIKAMFLLGASVLSLVVLADDSCKTLEQQIDAAGIERLVLHARVGEVEILAGEQAQIRVAVEACERSRWFSWGESEASDAQLVVAQDDGELALELNRDDYHETWTVQMPADIALATEMGVGDLQVSGLRSNIDLELGVGDIEVEAAAEDFGFARSDVGVGDSSVHASSGKTSHRREVVSSTSVWKSSGKSSISADIGVGDAGIVLN